MNHGATESELAALPGLNEQKAIVTTDIMTSFTDGVTSAWPGVPAGAD